MSICYKSAKPLVPDINNVNKEIDNFLPSIKKRITKNNTIIHKTTDQLLDDVINNSIDASTSGGSYNVLVRSQDRIISAKAKKKAIEIIKKSINNFSNISYSKWHEKLCLDLIDNFKNIRTIKGGLCWTYGNSQKIVNLTVKYIFIITKIMSINHNYVNQDNKQFYIIGKSFVKNVNNLDIPVDRIILNAANEYNKEVNNTLLIPYIPEKSCLNVNNYNGWKSWSKWDKNDYDKFMKSVHDTFPLAIEWEIVNWPHFR